MGKYIRRDTRNYFCVLALGKHFDVDQWLASVSLRPTIVWRQGESHNGRVSENSGLQIDLGDGNELDWCEQQDLAVEFLETNRDMIKSLMAAPGVETCWLGLQESVRTDSAGSMMDLSPSLMRIVLELKVQLTIWSCTVRTAEP